MMAERICAMKRIARPVEKLVLLPLADASVGEPW
jgi:hypothetical protein